MKQILVVDDDMMITGLLSEYLRKSGYRVVTACNGREAIESIETETPNLVLLDIEMPEMNGIETLKKIKDHFIS